MRPSSTIFPIVLLLGLSGCGGPPTPVVLVSIDTLRPDHLGCYGYPRPTSPNLDAFRKDAILFTNAFANAPSTLASHAAILTSSFLLTTGDQSRTTSRCRARS